MDICGKQHERFRDELILAKNNGIKLFVVVENKGGRIGKSSVFNPTITRLEDLSKWKNPRSFIFKGGKQAYPNATRGVSLMKACFTLKARYGCEFVFCTPEESGKMIVEILKGETYGNEHH
jgi:ribosome-associated protein